MIRTDASFIRSAGVVSALTLASRLLGLVREAVCAYFFGAGYIWDAFAIAFRIPNLARRLFGEGALSAAFIPVFASRLQTGERLAARRLAGAVILLLASVLTMGVVLGEIGIGIAQYFAPGLTLSLTALMLPYMVFICLVALLAGAQNVIGKFSTPAFMPILFNIIMISGIVAGSFLAPDDPQQRITILGGTVLLAGVAQLVVQWLSLVKMDFRPLLVWQPQQGDIRQIIGTMAPMLIGLSALQLNSLIDLVVARIFVEQSGAVSALSYGERLYQLPVGLCGAALATAIFPRLSRLVASDDSRAYSATLQLGLRLAIFVGIPSTLGLWAVRTLLVQVIYERGAFSPEDTVRTARVLGWYALGVWAYILQLVVLRGFYSLGNSKTPMRVTTVMVVLNLALNLVLVQFLEEAGVALATAATASLQVVILTLRFRTLGRTVDWSVIFKTLLRCGLAGALMMVAVLATVGWVRGLDSRAGALAICVLTGIAVYGVASRVLASRELADLRSAVSDRNS